MHVFAAANVCLKYSQKVSRVAVWACLVMNQNEGYAHRNPLKRELRYVCPVQASDTYPSSIEMMKEIRLDQVGFGTKYQQF